MKEFIRKVIVFFLFPILLLAYPLDILLSKFIAKTSAISFCADEYSVWNDIFENETKADIAIYGSSRAWVQFDPIQIADSLNYVTYNFGVDGHNFWIQYLRHKLFLKHNEKPKIILLSVDYSTLERRKDLYNYAQFLPYMLWNKEIKDYTSDYIGFKDADFNFPLLRYMGEFSVLKDALVANIKKGESRNKGFASKELEWKNAPELAETPKDSYRIKIDQETVELFDRFLLECANDKIKVVFVHAPVHTYGIKYLENNSEVVSLFKNFAKKYNLPFLNYLDDDICTNSKYFYNSTHLNAKGSSLFTEKLISDFRKSKAFITIK